jgi:hypothetical protein
MHSKVASRTERSVSLNQRQSTDTIETNKSASYGRILDRMLDEEVSPQTRMLSIRILEWMSCSYRRLRIHEILDGVSIRRDRTSVDGKTKLSRRVLNHCRPLIEDGPGNTLIFSVGSDKLSIEIID